MHFAPLVTGDDTRSGRCLPRGETRWSSRARCWAPRRRFRTRPPAGVTCAGCAGPRSSAPPAASDGELSPAGSGPRAVHGLPVPGLAHRPRHPPQDPGAPAVGFLAIFSLRARTRARRAHRRNGPAAAAPLLMRGAQIRLVDLDGSQEEAGSGPRAERSGTPHQTPVAAELPRSPQGGRE